jgi:hypothetical protein
MIHAINKDGREAYFTERVWNIMPKHKNGWIPFEDNKDGIVIPDEIIEFQKNLSELKAKQQQAEKSDSMRDAIDNVLDEIQAKQTKQKQSVEKEIAKPKPKQKEKIRKPKKDDNSKQANR